MEEKTEDMVREFNRPDKESDDRYRETAPKTGVPDRGQDADNGAYADLCYSRFA